MNEVDIRIRYSSPTSPVELAISTPLGVETAAHVWRVLHAVRVTPACSRLSREGKRLVLAASLTEHDGQQLSQPRTAEVLEALRTTLTSESPVRFREEKTASRSAVGFARPQVGDGSEAGGCQACA
ncbi:MAG: hypothetical protein JW940_18080 [Polyangiaceae bacterium]|nr:hypothetical protein [Polyangiaceae bacterium]